MVCPASLLSCSMLLFFFFNDTATTEIYTLSLHDASSDLPANRAPPVRRPQSGFCPWSEFLLVVPLRLPCYPPVGSRYRLCLPVQCLAPATAAAVAGSATRNSVPSPGFDRTVISPACCSIIPAATAKPRPVRF